MEKHNTLDFYNKNAETYFQQTVNGNMQEAYDKFLFYLPAEATILDFGCGSGRDSKYFIQKGYRVTAIDGSKELCELASKHIGQEVKCMRFEELNEEAIYDGIWACSSILHVERKDLPNILRRMLKALKEDGTIYTCFKTGDKEIIEDGKYYNYMTKELLEEMLEKENARIVEAYGSLTYANVDRPKANWGNYLVKKK